MTGSFDRAADFYDQTRGYPPGVQEAIGQAVLHAAEATPASRILELGIGTGRIALPIIRAGYPYTGIDHSPRMLEKLRAALAALPGAEERVRLVEGDVAHLPFATGSFDAVLTVHVFHLLPDRPAVIAESLRVLGRPGMLLNGRDEPINRQDDPARELFDTWEALLRDLGYENRQRSFFVSDEWREQGGLVDIMVGPAWETSFSLADTLSSIERRLWSSLWPIPDDHFATALAQLRDWAVQRFGDQLQQPIVRKNRFSIERARFL